MLLLIMGEMDDPVTWILNSFGSKLFTFSTNSFSWYLQIFGATELRWFCVILCIEIVTINFCGKIRTFSYYFLISRTNTFYQIFTRGCE